MRILTDSGETEDIWVVFIASSFTKTLLVCSQKSSFPSPNLSLYLLSFHLPSPPSTASRPSLLQRMRGIRSILPLSVHSLLSSDLLPPLPLPASFEPWPYISVWPICSFVWSEYQSINHAPSDTYSTKSRGSIWSWRSRGAGVSRGTRFTVSATGTRASLNKEK